MQLTSQDWQTVVECLEAKADDAMQDPEEFQPGAYEHISAVLLKAKQMNPSRTSWIYLEG